MEQFSSILISTSFSYEKPWYYLYFPRSLPRSVTSNLRNKKKEDGIRKTRVVFFSDAEMKNASPWALQNPPPTSDPSRCPFHLHRSPWRVLPKSEKEKQKLKPNCRLLPTDRGYLNSTPSVRIAPPSATAKRYSLFSPADFGKKIENRRLGLLSTVEASSRFRRSSAGVENAVSRS